MIKYNYFKALCAIFLLLMILSSSAYGQPERRLYRIDKPDSEILTRIERSGGIVNRYVPKQFAEVYLTEKEYNLFSNSGINLYAIEDKEQSYIDSLFLATIDSPKT